MTEENSPKKTTRWFRTHFEDGGSVLLQTEESTHHDEIFRPLLITAAPVTEQVYVISPNSKNSVLSKEFREDPPPNTEILTSMDLEDSFQVIRNHDHSRSRLIIFIDSVSKMIEQVGWGDFEDAIISILNLAAQGEGVVYIHQRESELDVETGTALARICDMIAEYDERSGNWIILDRN